jgi:sugar phosphate isomerase/epimerase
MKGPGLFLAQFAGDAAPFNSWDAITKWAAETGYVGVQIPTWDGRLFDLAKAASSQDYCDELKGKAKENGVEVTELSTHLQGQLVAVHPTYDAPFDGFAAPEVRGNPKARQEWAVEQVKMALKASNRLGLNAMATFSGALAWPFTYPWPQRPAGLIDTAFGELAKRWTPILDVAEENGVDVCVCGICTFHSRRSIPSQYGVNVACIAGLSPFDFDEVPVMEGRSHPKDRSDSGPITAGWLSFRANTGHKR